VRSEFLIAASIEIMRAFALIYGCKNFEGTSSVQVGGGSVFLRYVGAMSQFIASHSAKLQGVSKRALQF
jgi:hypothetical protein